MTRLPRRLHAGAWWLWAGGLVAAATQTTNPILLALVLAVSTLVVVARRSATGWAGGYRAYLLVALAVIAIRVVFRLLLGGDFGSEVLITLPRLSLPGWTGGMQLGGVVTAEEVLAGSYDGLRLATVIVCIGAVNTLADPRRLLGSLPRALGGIATSLVVALSLAPQLVESLARVGRARRLRGEGGKGLRGMRSLLVPVLEDALHRSLALAASMDSRGYGRLEPDRRRRPLLTQATAWVSLGLVCVGAFALLSGAEILLPASLVAMGAVAGGAALVRMGRAVVRTRYRPEAWGAPEWLVSTSGVAAAVGLFLAGVFDPTALTPSLEPLLWPAVGPFAVAAILVAATPAVASPPVPRPVTNPIMERAA